MRRRPCATRARGIIEGPCIGRRRVCVSRRSHSEGALRARSGENGRDLNAPRSRGERGGDAEVWNAKPESAEAAEVAWAGAFGGAAHLWAAQAKTPVPPKRRNVRFV